MVSSEYANAYAEILEILKHISEEDYNKIPKNKIEMFEEYANKDFEFVYDPKKTLEEQNVSSIARYIIAILFRDYWATEKQKKIILENENLDKANIEREKREKYNPDKIFEDSKEEEDVSENHLTIEKEDTIFTKIIRKLKDMIDQK